MDSDGERLRGGEGCEFGDCKSGRISNGFWNRTTLQRERLRSCRLQDVYAVNVVVMSCLIHCVETGSTVTALSVLYEEGGVV